MFIYTFCLYMGGVERVKSHEIAPGNKCHTPLDSSTAPIRAVGREHGAANVSLLSRPRPIHLYMCVAKPLQ